MGEGLVHFHILPHGWILRQEVSGVQYFFEAVVRLTANIGNCTTKNGITEKKGQRQRFSDRFKTVAAHHPPFHLISRSDEQFSRAYSSSLFQIWMKVNIILLLIRLSFQQLPSPFGSWGVANWFVVTYVDGMLWVKFDHNEFWYYIGLFNLPLEGKKCTGNLNPFSKTKEGRVQNT